MAKQPKTERVKPRILKGFRDIEGGAVRARERMIARIREVYERYGFAPLETPALEYVDALGKFLPESDTPTGGIFAFRDEDEEWVALRYDLTAPLSRYVAMHFQDLPIPYRRYQVGPVYRVEKPGPGRFREFYQFDFDTVGTGSMLADAESCMVMCDTLEALGVTRGQYIVRVNNRKILTGVLERIAGGKPMPESTALQILRCIDKLDRLGMEGVRLLLGPGRKDESGAFVRGVELPADRIDKVMAYLDVQGEDRVAVCDGLSELIEGSATGAEGVEELRRIDEALTAAGYAPDRVVFDPTVVRGLEYYTGPVFEGALTFEIVDEKGVARPFGSVFGGGRYDGLVQRFTGQQVPATGASIGVDRLLAALMTLGTIEVDSGAAKVLVTRLDKKLTAEYQRMVADLRAAGLSAELYVGTQSIGKQFKYASQSGKIVAVVMGSDELEKGEVSIKDLRLGDELSAEIGADRKTWLEQQPAQFTAPRELLAEKVKEVLARYEKRRLIQ